ncbi:MAG: hypothetical protein FWE76_00550 [Symbiobacteriaceae bacterium]|nr:hypothetical protein [Symbiobacteriaceae bacterium]
MRLRRTLPYPGRLLVSLGEDVSPATIIAETTLQPEEPIHFTVTEAFGIPPYDIKTVLRVQEGDIISQGQVLATGIISGQGVELRSPVSGIIEQVSMLLGTVSLRLEGDPNDRDRIVDVAKDLEMIPLLAAQYIQVRVGDFVYMGQEMASDSDKEARSLAPMQGEITAINGSLITITRPFIRTQVSAFVSGRITTLIPGWGAEVESEMVPVSGLFGLGGECFGVLHILTKHPAEQADPLLVTADHKGGVLVVGALASSDLLTRCRHFGVAGVIAGGAHNKHLVDLLGEEITPGMDTKETLGLSLMLMGGMGEIPIEEHIFDLLRKSEGSMVSLTGLTQIRSGVIRPCVYLLADPSLPIRDEPSRQGNDSITIGSVVRIIREPYFGVRGRVTGFAENDMLPSGIRTLTYIVLNESGDELRIPRSNVELI